MNTFRRTGFSVLSDIPLGRGIEIELPANEHVYASWCILLTAFQKVYANLHYHQQCRRVPATGGFWVGKEGHVVDDCYTHKKFNLPLRVVGSHWRFLDRRVKWEKLYKIHLRLALVIPKEYTGWVVRGLVLVFLLLKPTMAPWTSDLSLGLGFC